MYINMKLSGHWLFFSCSQEILNKKIKFINYLIIQFENMTGNTGKVYEVRKKEKAGV